MRAPLFDVAHAQKMFPWDSILKIAILWKILKNCPRETFFGYVLHQKGAPSILDNIMKGQKSYSRDL